MDRIKVPPKFVSWRRRVSGLARAWNRFLDQFIDDRLLDSTDSRPLHSSFDVRRSTRQSAASVGDVGAAAPRLYDSFGKPLAPIYRTMEGKFVLDKDSEEGGFTSPRKQIRSLTRRRPPIIYGQQSRVPVAQFSPQRRGDYLGSGYESVPVEGGVYDVRAGTTHALVHPDPTMTRAVIETQGPIEVRGPFEHPLMVHEPFAPPEFGQHVIIDSRMQSPLDSRQRIRSSSPRQFVNEWNRLAHLASFSEMSSVKQPSSVERSFPSTIFSSFHTSLQKTPPAAGGTPLNASALLRRHPNSEFDRVIREQEMLLEKNRLVVRQKEMRQTPSKPPDDVIPPHLLYPSNERFYYPQYIAPWISPRGPVVLSRDRRPTVTTHYDGSSAPLYHPPYREPVFIISEPSAMSPHYVNVSTRSGVPFYSQIPRRPPYYILKPTPTDTSKPLATSSPPGSPGRSSSEKRRAFLKKTGPSPSVKASKKPRKDASLESDTSDEQPASYTRDKLQKAIGRVRSGDISRHERPHSAPNFSSTGTPDNSFMESTRKMFSKAKKIREEKARAGDVSQEKSDELSTELSPSSSSGFGSKNTSQQQSSQSGQSASALGLDASRLDTSEIMKPFPESQEWEVTPHYQDMSINVLRHPYPVIVSSYERGFSHQIFPLHVQPEGFAVSSSLLMGVPRPEKVQQRPPFPLYQNVTKRPVLVESHAISRPKVKVLPPKPSVHSGVTPSDPSTSGASAAPPTLDISVDDHYEFDTLLSPMPEDTDSFWSRSHSRQGDRGLSDSEVEAASAARKTDHESMEARVAAMKREFHQYRQKQAKKRSDRELESVC